MTTWNVRDGLALNPVDSVKSSSPSYADSKTIAILIPVFNALEYVKECIKSVIKNTETFQVSVIIINDASDQETTDWLVKIHHEHPEIQLIHNEINLGYTRSINLGLQASLNTDYVILLNSDTVVTRSWLSNLTDCAESSDRIGIVGPLSNAASWQSVPYVFDENQQFAINILPDGVNIDEYAKLVTSFSRNTYPKAQFVNGFCFLIKRSVINDIGSFDEVSFPRGYGEENDFCVRAKEKGFTLAIADNCYVYHAKSKSFGHQQRIELCEEGRKSLYLKHGDKLISDLIHRQKSDTSLNYLRFSLLREFNQLPTESLPDFKATSFLFVLPVAGGSGGSHSIVQETVALRKIGIRCNIAVEQQNLPHFYELYADIADHKDIFLGFNKQTINNIAASFDVVIGTIFHSMSIVNAIINEHPHILPAYYIQDYEPLFFDDGSELQQEASDSYTLIPNAALFAKTHWICREVEKQHGVNVHKVSPSIDHDVYFPAQQPSRKNVSVAAMIRPQTPRRGAERTMQLFKELQQQLPNLTIHTFGCNPEDHLFLDLEQDFEFTHHGILTRPKVADLLRSIDIFIDLSDYQAFGRTSLEAMACGATAVVPQNGGGDEYARDNVNALIVDTLDKVSYTQRIKNLLSDPDKILDMKLNGLMTAAKYSPHAAAISELTTLYKDLREHRVFHPVIKKPTLWVVTPLRNDGLPVGSAYVRLHLPLNVKEVKNNWNVRFATKQELPSPSDGDIAIIQRDAAGYDVEKISKWAKEWKQNGNSIIFEIDDNLLDESGIKQRSDTNASLLATATQSMYELADAVIVSTSELKEVLSSIYSKDSKDSKISPDIHIIENKLDKGLWRIGKGRLEGSDVFPVGEDGIVRIGYVGTPTHNEDLQLIIKAIKKIEKKYKNRVQIEVIGAFQRDLKNPLFGDSVSLPSQNTYPEFVNWLHKRVNWDIAVIPLVDDDFNRSKSHLKFLECTALGMACICSDVPSYNSIVEHGKNGLLCDNTSQQWYEHLDLLIRAPKLRKRLAKQAYVDIEASYTTESNGSLYNDLFNKILHQRYNGGNQVQAIPTTRTKSVKGLLMYRLFPYLDDQYSKSRTLSQRRMRKLLHNPYQYFYDSKNKPLRYMRFLFSNSHH